MWMNEPDHPPRNPLRACGAPAERRAQPRRCSRPEPRSRLTEQLLLCIYKKSDPGCRFPAYISGLHRHLGDPGGLLHFDHVAKDGNLGISQGMVRFFSTRMRPALSCSAPVAAARALASGGPPPRRSTTRSQRRSRSPGRRGRGPAIDLVDIGDDRDHVQLHRQRIQGAGGFCDGVRPNEAGNSCRRRTPASRASSGLMVRNSARRVLVATSRIFPTSSTPVGPPPTRAKVG